MSLLCNPVRWIRVINLKLNKNRNSEDGRGVESDTEGCETDTSTSHKVFNFPLLVKDKRKFPLCEKERTKANIRWVKSTKGKGIFRLWTESGWRHALVGAEMGKVFLTVWQVTMKKLSCIFY